MSSDYVIPNFVTVLVPDPDRSGFRLDRTPLGTARLADPLRALTFTLNQSKLGGTAKLYPVVDPGDATPYNLTDWIVSVSCRSNQSTEPGGGPQAGSATIVLKNMPAAWSLSIGFNTPIFIRQPSLPGTYNRLIWSGWVQSVRESWDEFDGDTFTTLEAIDLPAVLGSVTRYGANPADPESLRDRFNRLATSVPPFVDNLLLSPNYSDGISGFTKSGDPFLINPTVMETSLLRHFTMAAISARTVLSIPYDSNRLDARDLYYWYRDDREPSRVFSDQPPTPAEPNLVSYLSIDRASGGELTATSVTVTTHSVGPGGEAVSNSLVVTDVTATDALGPQPSAADVLVPVDDLDGIGQWLLPPGLTFLPEPTSITVRGTDATFATGQPLNILAAVEVRRLGISSPCVIVGVEHNITPRLNKPARHRTTLRLARRP